MLVSQDSKKRNDDDFFKIEEHLHENQNSFKSSEKSHNKEQLQEINSNDDIIEENLFEQEIHLEDKIFKDQHPEIHSKKEKQLNKTIELNYPTEKQENRSKESNSYNYLEKKESENFQENVKNIKKELLKHETMPIMFENTENLSMPEQFAFSKHVEIEVPTYTEVANIVISEANLDRSIFNSLISEQISPIQDLPVSINEELSSPERLEDIKGTFISFINIKF